MPDIEERLSRFEWDRMNLADLTGMLQGCYCPVSSLLNSQIISIVRLIHRGMHAFDAQMRHAWIHIHLGVNVQARLPW